MLPTSDSNAGTARPSSSKQSSSLALSSSSLLAGRKRTRSCLPKLSSSFSCPHLPLLSAGTSSPAAVTSAVAFGATTPTSGIFWNSSRPRSAKTIAEESPSYTTTYTRGKRLSMSGFPWEDRFTSGKKSPAVELAESITRKARPVTPPAQLVHAKSEPTGNSFRDGISPKSGLRLQLPPRLHAAAASQPEIPGPSSDTTCNHRHHKGFTGQTLLGLAYPTTPDIGINNSPVMCETCKDEQRICSQDRAGGGGVVGEGVSSAQHLLMAAGPHMARGGLALLTPPDDNGILDWQQDSVHRIQADRETTVRMINNIKDFPATPHLPEAATDEEAKTTLATPANDGRESASQSGSSSTAAAGVSISTPENNVDDNRPVLSEGEWIESAMETLVGSAFPVCMATEAIRILSYTLPCPLPDAPGPDVSSSSVNPVNLDRLPASAMSAPAVAAAAGELLSPAVMASCISKESNFSTPKGSDTGTTTALYCVTAAIQRRFLNEGPGRVYIHVSHAIDPQIPLSRLPSTPPITGGFSSACATNNAAFENGEGGYFAPTVFNSIVVAPNSLATPSSIPRQASPTFPFTNPILPPNSLHLTLLERYIPPSSPTEDAAMFSTKSSILIDRLFELSPNGGSVLFIYPTKTGAMNFDRDYLGPVLDPLLRRLMVLHGLREDLLWGVRNMTSTPHMAEFDVLSSRVQAFCTALTNGENDLQRTPTKLVYSSKATVNLNDLSWREWWTQQEQIRIREMVKKHMTANPQVKSSRKNEKAKETESRSNFWQGYGQPGDLAREILDGVRAPATRPSSRGMGEAVLASSMSASGSGGGTRGVDKEKHQCLRPFARRGVEVGVFILRRGR